MDVETVGDAFVISIILVFFIVFGVAAVVYAIIKKKKDYDTKGVPKLVIDKPVDRKGTTDQAEAVGNESGPDGGAVAISVDEASGVSTETDSVGEASGGPGSADDFNNSEK